MTHNSCNMSVRRKNIRNADLEMNPWTCMRPGLLKCPSWCVFHRITSGIQVQSTRSHRRQLTVHDGMTVYCPNENCVPQDFPFVDCCIFGSYWHVTSCDEIFWLRSAHSHLNWREGKTNQGLSSVLISLHLLYVNHSFFMMRYYILVVFMSSTDHCYVFTNPRASLPKASLWMRCTQQQ